MKATIGDFLAGAIGGVVMALAMLAWCGCGFSIGDDRELAPDAAAVADALPDASPVFATLGQTADGVIEPTVGARCQASPPFGSTGDQAWYRVYPLAHAFAVTDVHLRLAYARDARGVQVKIGRYTGAAGGPSLALSGGGATWLVTTTLDMPDAGGPFDVNIGGAAPVAELAAGESLIVGIVAPSYTSQTTQRPAAPLRAPAEPSLASPGGGALRLGFTIAPESAPSYFASSACAVPAATSTEAMGAPGHLVLEVSGWATP